MSKAEFVWFAVGLFVGAIIALLVVFIGERIDGPGA